MVRAHSNLRLLIHLVQGIYVNIIISVDNLELTNGSISAIMVKEKPTQSVHPV